MKTASLKEVLTENSTVSPNHYLYSVEGQQVLLYVGKSKHPLQRVQQHIIKGGTIGYDTLGELVFCNLPDSLGWQVHFYTLADCAQAVYDVFVASSALSMGYFRRYQQAAAQETFPQQEDDAYLVLSAIAKAEIVLIEQLRPCLNVTYNTHERIALPATIINHTAFPTLYPTAALARQRLRSYLQHRQKEGGIHDVAT